MVLLTFPNSYENLVSVGLLYSPPHNTQLKICLPAGFTDLLTVAALPLANHQF